MSARQWKPGDVALVRVSDTVTLAVRGRKPFDHNWYTAGPVLGSRTMVSDSMVCDSRPLVVIDPDDREQVERLRQEFNLVSGQDYKGEWVPDMQKALHRAFISDPKPDEPLGLGAVVEDANGTRWIRTGDCSLDWVTEFNTETHPWSKIAAVRVLSEGVVTDA